MLLAHTSPVEHTVIVAVGLGAIALYGWAWFRSSTPSIGRLSAWCGGVLTLLLAVLPSMERWAERSFTGHMVQHLMMIVVAAPLLVLAAPVRTLHVLWQHRVSPAERSVARRWRSHGASLAAAGFIGVLYLTHLTEIYDIALQNRFVHDIEHVAYVGSAVALWAALRAHGRAAAPARVAAVFAVIGSTALLGVVLMSASSPLVATYAELLGVGEALDDQRSAAALMWVGGMATTLPLLVVSVWGWAAAEERLAERSEALASARHRDETD